MDIDREKAARYGLNIADVQQIIATAVGGIPDIVLPGKTGLLVSPGDEAALTDAMLVMRRDYDTYNLRKVRERAERTYSEKAVEAVLIRVYADAIRSQ